MLFPNKFISAGTEYADYDKIVPAPYIRKNFTIESEFDKADIIITGLGFYRLFINGTEITKCKMAPYISNPDQIVYFDRYDITKYLKKGVNTVGLILGNGFQNCFEGTIWDFDKAKWRSAPKTALRIEVKCENKNVLSIESDDTFKIHPSPILLDQIRFGEHYDARLEIENWNKPEFDDSLWNNAVYADTPRGEYRICSASPIVVGDELKPVSVTPYEDGYLYDFGVNAAGVCRLQIKGHAGQEITMQHGEWYHDGKLDMRNLTCESIDPRRADLVQCCKYICKGSEIEVFEPWFAYFGFRYVYVKGIEKDQATKELLTYLVLHGDFKETAAFECSDKMANTLQEITRRSDLSNFLWYPTDCPHREKNGWTGDAAVSAEHILLNLTAENSFKEWLNCVAAAQNDEGALPGIVPTGGWGFKWGNGPAWDAALVEIIYCLYRFKGDLDTARELGTNIFRYIHYLSHKRNSCGLIAIGLGDWCPVEREAYQYKSPLEVTDTLISMDILRKSSVLFRKIGWADEAEFTDKIYVSLRNSFREHLIDFDTMNIAGNCQTSQAMALYYNVLEESEKPMAFERLKEYIAEQNDHFDCGLLGLRVIFHVLTAFGESDLAFKMITRPDFPSYGNWAARGATSLWEEFWREDKPDTSQNHHFFGDISSWFIQKVAGIVPNPDLTNVNSILVEPHFVECLDYAKASYEAPKGKINVCWSRKVDNIEIDIDFSGDLDVSLKLQNETRKIERNCRICVENI